MPKIDKYTLQSRQVSRWAHFVVHLLGLELGQRESDLGRRGGGGQVEAGRRVVVVPVHDAVLLAVGRTARRAER